MINDVRVEFEVMSGWLFGKLDMGWYEYGFWDYFNFSDGEGWYYEEDMRL